MMTSKVHFNNKNQTNTIQMIKTRIHLAVSANGKSTEIDTYLPVLYLAGPVRNAPRWHEEVIRKLLVLNVGVHVACPAHHLSADLMSLVESDKGYPTFDRSASWENHYLDCAAKNGVIMFWLPGEIEHKEFSQKKYAHKTMLALGKWLEKAKADQGIHLVIGTDGLFPEWSSIKHQLEVDYPEVIVNTSLEDTVAKAVRMTRVYLESSAGFF